MFLSIIRPFDADSGSSEGERQSTQALIECSRIHVRSFEHKPDVLFIDAETERGCTSWEIQKDQPVQVWALNDEGKTVDRIFVSY